MAPASTAVRLDFDTISGRLHDLVLPDVDVVVGIATGGAVPAALVAHQLRKPLALVTINFRAPDNTPQRPVPELLSELPHLPAGSHLLLVDEASVTGATLAAARALFADHPVTTLVLKGKGDLVVFPEVRTCVAWPWKR